MLNKDFKEFIKLLNKEKVEYLLVGGYAVILHGHVRFTGDIDFWINPTLENATRMVKVLKEFGFGKLDVGVKDFTRENFVIQLGIHPNRIDVLTSLEGVTFNKCYKNAEVFNIDNLSIKTISKKYLKINKRATGRHKDLDDLQNL